MMDIPKPGFIGGDEDAWLGYWGSIVGIMGAYFVLKIQLKSDNKKYKSETVDNTFFNLLNLHNDILKENTKLIEGISKDLSQMHKEVNNREYRLECEKYAEENHEKLNDKIKELPDNDNIIEVKFDLHIESEEFKLDLSPIVDCEYKEIIEEYLITGEISNVDTYIELYGNKIILENNVTDSGYDYYLEELEFSMEELERIAKKNLEYNNHIEKQKENGKSTNTYSEVIDSDYAEYCKQKDIKIKEMIIELFSREEVLKNVIIQFEKIEPHIRKVFENHLVSFGYYFRLFHRIIKFLNENKEQEFITEEQLNNYLGILRAMIDEKTMALIYYNAIYLPKGENMKIELRKNTFFGNKEDFDDSKRKHNFLSNETLLFDVDYDKLKELTKVYPLKEN